MLSRRNLLKTSVIAAATTTLPRVASAAPDYPAEAPMLKLTEPRT